MKQHDTLLIACGSRENRDRLRSVLKQRYNLLEATNTRQMLLLLEQNLHCIASVVLDISNWDMIDKDALAEADSVTLLKKVPVIVVADQEAYQDLTVYFRYGAADVLPLNYDPHAMLRRIETITQLTLHKKQLEEVVAEQQENLRRFSDNMVDALSAIIEYRNMESGLHILRIRNFTRILLEEVMRHCPEYGLTEETVSIISRASALHDVGKIGIPDAILTKAGPLTSGEWEIMKTHSQLGCQMLNTLGSTVDREYLRYAYNICRYHHERWDGRGYPDGLAGEQIPICAQVVGLADCYDALTSDRVYRKGLPHSSAVNMILGGECGAFSGKLQECFKNVTHQFAQLRDEYADGRDPGETIGDLTIRGPSSLEETVNLVEKTQAKYYCMVHYMNAFLVEVQLDTGLFQVMYNPYPELANVQAARTLQDLTDIVARQVVIPEEEERMYRVIWEELPRFVEQDLRRQSFYFHHRPYAEEPGGEFEMTFLRIGGNTRPSLAIVCRKMEQPQRKGFSDDSALTNFNECTYVCRNDSGFTLVRTGRDTVSLGGYTPQEVMELFGGRLLDMAYPEERAQIRQEFDRQLKEGSMVRTEYRFLCKDGSTGWVVNKSRAFLGEDGREYLQTFLFDITASKAAYTKLSQTLNRYQIILAQTENALFDLDMTSMQIDLSDTWQSIFGYMPSQESFLDQMSGGCHVHPDDIPLLLDRLSLMEAGSDYEMVEIRIATDKGRYLWCRVRGSGNRDPEGKLLRIVGIIINIDSEKQAQLALEDRANRDNLTQLLNKEEGRRQIESYLSQARRDSKCALMILDLDNFKEVNDRYGHLFGDALLKQVAQILTSLFHSQDILSRIGGDEFMVLVRGISDRQLLASQCRRLRDMLLRAFRNDTLELSLGCSIGIALCPEHANHYFSLFSMADQALYQAKAGGKNDVSFYEADGLTPFLPSGRHTTPIDSDNVPGFAWDDSIYQVFRILYQAQDCAAAVNQVIALMGKRTNVSRVYIFENSEDDTYCINTFEWCNQGISPQIQNLQYVSYETDIPNYRDNFSEDGVFYCHDVRDLPPSAYAVVEPQGIQSMLHCALRRDGKFKGYIGFDECSTKRLWTKDEIQVLSFFSEILSIFLLRYREQERARVQAEELQTILENQGQWTYILDPESRILKYVTDQTRRARPGVQLGELCYKSLMGRDKPCVGCPLEKLGSRRSAWSLAEDGKYAIQVLVQATRIKWQGESCCLLSCSRLLEE